MAIFRQSSQQVLNADNPDDCYGKNQECEPSQNARCPHRLRVTALVLEVPASDLKQGYTGSCEAEQHRDQRHTEILSLARVVANSRFHPKPVSEMVIFRQLPFLIANNR
jgi:hypothetical protein